MCLCWDKCIETSLYNELLVLLWQVSGLPAQEKRWAQLALSRGLDGLREPPRHKRRIEWANTPQGPQMQSDSQTKERRGHSVRVGCPDQDIDFSATASTGPVPRFELSHFHIILYTSTRLGVLLFTSITATIESSRPFSSHRLSSGRRHRPRYEQSTQGVIHEEAMDI